MLYLQALSGICRGETAPSILRTAVLTPICVFSGIHLVSSTRASLPACEVVTGSRGGLPDSLFHWDWESPRGAGHHLAGRRQAPSTALAPRGGHR